MNIANLIIRLQELADATTDASTLLALSKSIEKAKVGAVQTVATYADLPTLPLAEDGDLFFVEADEDIYFNVGSTWDRFRPFVYEALSWGRNAGGYVGDGTTIDRSSPVTVAGGITNWSDVSAGSATGIGLTNTGTIYTWGAGFNGRLGDDSTVAKSSPVTVVGGITWSAIASHSYSSHVLALSDTGVLYAWGSGNRGRLGDDSEIDKSSPVTVVGGITNWSTVSAGGQHNLAITSTGVLYAWGYGGFGRLGTNDAANRSSPVTVVGGITNWSAVSTGSGHSLGLTDTGVLYAWGFANNGRLGTGDTVHRSSPVTIIGGITTWSQVSAGDVHTLGLTDAGVLYAWGQNSSGQLGDGTDIQKSSPVTVVGGITNWSKLSSSGHNLGLTDTGVLYAWGAGSFGGKLGANTGINQSSPVTVVGGITNWTAIAAGGFHSLAISSS